MKTTEKHHYDINKTYTSLAIKLVIIRKPEQQHEDVVQYETNIPSVLANLKHHLKKLSVRKSQAGIATSLPILSWTNSQKPLCVSSCRLTLNIMFLALSAIAYEFGLEQPCDFSLLNSGWFTFVMKEHRGDMQRGQVWVWKRLEVHTHFLEK